jgi:hypothetical protein
MQLRLLSAQPATDYYAWQVEVYLENFINLGYNGNLIDVVAAYKGVVPRSWRIIQQKFPYVRFFFYEDTTTNCNYPPAIQAHILEKHFTEHPYLEEDAIFFHDCDFIFTKYFDFTPYLQDNKWYFSDTISYIGYNYISSKGDNVVDKMCEIIGIDKELVKANQDNSGGAQKLMKNINADYWKQVYHNSLNLYNGLGDLAREKKEGDAYGLQIWCASMWAELWTAWKLGHEVIVPKEFDFCWATCPVERWDQVSFFHNAGVPDANQGMFFKADYINKYPFDTNIEVSKRRCSYNYYQFIKSIKSHLV